MTQDPIASIAGKLSEAQRDWLLAMPATTDRIAREPCAEWWDNPGKLYVTIDYEDIWLAGREMCSPEGEPRFTHGWEQLSEIGLAVRSYLERQSHGQE